MNRIPIHRQPIYNVRVPDAPAGNGRTAPLGSFGRYAGPATLILSSLADGPKHGYALTKDIENFAGIRLAPGTLYEALSRLEAQGMIEALAAEDRRRPYQLTAAGAAALRVHLNDQRRVADVGLGRLAKRWGHA
jgi:DNA-binding PadR family transcriptional regulator